MKQKNLIDQPVDSPVASQSIHLPETFISVLTIWLEDGQVIPLMAM